MTCLSPFLKLMSYFSLCFVFSFFFKLDSYFLFILAIEGIKYALLQGAYAPLSSPFQERANLWWVSQLHAQSASGASFWETLPCQWSSGRLSSRCGPPLTTRRSAVLPQMPKTSPSVALWPSAPTPCWVTPPSAPGRLRESWSGCGARSGD